MTAFRYALKSVNVMNGLLLAAVAAAGYFTAVPFLTLNVKPSLPAVQATAAPSAEQAASHANPSPADYAVISGQNPFHPDRIVPREKKELPRPEVYLYGTIITDDMSVAFIEDKKSPYSTAGRGKRPRMLRKGAQLSGYVLQDVLADRVVLVRGDDRIVVLLDDPEKRRASAAGSAPAAAAAPPARSPAAAAASGPSPAGTPAAAAAVPPPVPAGKAVAASPAPAAPSGGQTANLPSWLPSTRLQRIEAQKQKAEIYRQNRLGSQ
jgi:hypothetical protein